MINILELMEKLAYALQVKSLDMDSNSENTENWDSLGTLAIITTLSRLTDGKSDLIPEIASVTAMNNLIELLKEHGLVNDV